MSIVTVLSEEVLRLRKRDDTKRRQLAELRRQRNMWRARARADAKDAANWRRWKATG